MNKIKIQLVCNCLLLRISEKPLFSGINLMLVNNYKRIFLSNDSLSPAHPIVLEQAKP